MIALRYRDQLPPVVVDEFEALIAQLRGFLSVGHREDGSLLTRPAGFDFVPVGAILDWGTDTPPFGWLICDGTPLSRTEYKPLFDVIGTTYGAGDGSTTFNLPDFRQRVAVGKAATGTATALGETGGAVTHTLTEDELPEHTHDLTDPGHEHTVRRNTNVIYSAGTSEVVLSTGTPGAANIVDSAVTGITIDATGADEPHNNMQPFLVTNKIILSGVGL